MVKLLRLEGAGNIWWAIVGEDGRIYFAPYWDEMQALIATSEPEDSWSRIRRIGLYWRAVAGAPHGYHFFVQFDELGHIVGVVVSGPYGLLPGVYATLEAASEAAWEDWWDKNPGERPLPPGPAPI